MSNLCISLGAAVRTIVRVSRNIHTHRIVYGNHYETLKLPRNCTNKDVRDSFIKLSKQLHPDRNQDDPNMHAQFVKLNEAYHILSRPDKRRAYDLTLQTERHFNPRHQPFDVYTTAYRERVVWRDESFWEFQDRSRYNTHDTRDFYGIKGIRRVPNSWIALLCIIVSAIGVLIQFLLIRESTAFNRKRLTQQSEDASKVLADVQEQAVTHGNKAQLEKMKQRLNQGSLPSDAADNKPKEIANVPEMHRKNAHTYNTGGPSVIVISETEIGNLVEKKSPVIVGQTGYLLEVEVLSELNTTEDDILKTDLMRSIDTKSLHTLLDTPTQNGVPMSPEESVKKRQFLIMVGNGHDIKVTNLQSQLTDENLIDTNKPLSHPGVVVMDEPEEAACEMRLVNRL